MLSAMRDKALGLWMDSLARLYLTSCQRVGAGARLRGRPILENRGEIVVGKNLRMFSHVARSELWTGPGGRLQIGDNVFINCGVQISACRLVTIGDSCLIGNHTLIMDSDFHGIEQRGDGGKAAPIRIDHDVWLGARVIVLKGVRIGRGSVVAAGSVVTRDVAPRTVVAGVPARFLRSVSQLDLPLDPDTVALGRSGPQGVLGV